MGAQIRRTRLASLVAVISLAVVSACSSSSEPSNAAALDLGTGSESEEQAGLEQLDTPGAHPAAAEPEGVVPGEDAWSGGSTAGPSDSSTQPDAESPSSKPRPSPTVDEQDAQATFAGKGIDQDGIKIGMTYSDSSARAALIAGLSGRDVSEGGKYSYDGEAATLAIVDYINAHGGVGGHSLLPVFYEPDPGANTTTAEGRAREAQGMCARWTEDETVFAILNPGFSDASLLDCALRSHTVLINGGTAQYVDQARYSELSPIYFHASDMIIDDRESAVIEGLERQGFFAEGARVGLMIDGSDPSFQRAADRVTRPMLTALGVEVVSEIVYPDFISSPWSTYVLQMQSRGVSHVLWSATNGNVWALYFFSRSAEDQRYRPAYGVGSDNNAAGAAFLGTPSAQFEQLTGIGWQPSWDLGLEGQQNPAYFTPRTTLCRKILADAGQDNSTAVHDQVCERLFFLKDVADSASELSFAGFGVAVEALGRSYVPVTGFGTHFAPGRPPIHAGANVFRPFAYDSAVNGFTYTGPPYSRR